MQSISRYQKRISGPLLDRIDIHIEVPRVDVDKLTADRLAEPSEAIRARVETARAGQRDRFENTSLAANADMGPTEVRSVCQLSEEGRAPVRAAMAQLGMSARAFHRILKLARTIADLAGSERNETTHLAEAVQYRPRGETWPRPPHMVLYADQVSFTTGSSSFKMVSPFTSQETPKARMARASNQYTGLSVLRDEDRLSGRSL